MSEWQPIETCPEDGEFLAYDPVAGKQDVCTFWAEIRGKRYVLAVQLDGEYGPGDHEFMGDRATHWMPLPEPPK